MTIPFSEPRILTTQDLNDVADTQPLNNQILKYNLTANQYEPSSDVEVNTTTENVALSNSYNADTGSDNVVIGIDTGENITTAGNNVIIGRKAAEELTTGESNTIIGEQAGEELTTSSNNTMIGRKAGNETTGSNNVYIGNEAGSTSLGSSNVHIGHLMGADELGSGSGGGSNQILIGNNGDGSDHNNLTVIATNANTKLTATDLANNTVFLGNNDMTETYLFGGKLQISESSGDITYKTRSASTKHTFMTNNNVEGLAIEDAKVKFQTEVRFAGEHASVAAAGSPPARTIAFIDNEPAFYNGNNWKKFKIINF